MRWLPIGLALWLVLMTAAQADTFDDCTACAASILNTPKAGSGVCSTVCSEWFGTSRYREWVKQWMTEHPRPGPPPWPLKWNSRWEIGQFCAGKATSLQYETLMGGHVNEWPSHAEQSQALMAAHMSKHQWEFFYYKCVSDELFNKEPKPQGLLKNRNPDEAGHN
jgi:hypothetical protein